MDKLFAVLVAGLFAAAPAFAQEKAAPAKMEEAKKVDAKKDAAAPKKEKKGGC